MALVGSILDAKREGRMEADLILAKEANERLEKSLEEAAGVVLELRRRLDAETDAHTDTENKRLRLGTAYNRVYSKYAGIKAMKDYLLKEITAHPERAAEIVNDKQKMIQVGREAEYAFLINECGWGKERSDIHSGDTVQQTFWKAEVDQTQLEPATCILPEPAGYETGQDVIYKGGK